MNSKIQLIKSKCMSIKPKLKKSESKKSLNSGCVENELLNDSVDMES
jgi:hypothetical protein